MGKRALVFGASGVSGWSFVNEILNDYPKKGIWDGVVAMTNRPLKQQDSSWPADDRLQIVSGVDLLRDEAEIEDALKKNVKDVDKVTHVYYLGEHDRPMTQLRYRMLTLQKHTKHLQTSNRNWKMLSTCSKTQLSPWIT